MVKPTHKAVKAYHETLEKLGSFKVRNEGALRTAFQTLLTDTARTAGWMLVPEQSLKAGGRTIIPDGTLRLEGIPPETFEYRVGNRSALEWVIDQYQVSTDKRSGIQSDPNRPGDEPYIVRLVEQVVQVSVETVRIVKSLPLNYGAGLRALAEP
jgi:predicted helicase